MSSNPFAILDDSGDEGPKKIKTVEKKAAKPKPTKPKVAEPSKVDQNRRPNQHDRNTKFGRGGRAPARDGKRAYDRRSGTGRGKEGKKGGGGAHNWGSDKNEARQAEGHVEEGAVGEAPPKEDETENNEAPAPAEEAEVVPEPEPEPEEITISYEEYMATKDNLDNDAFAPVKEREVDDEFAGKKVAAVVIDESFLVMGGGKQKKKKNKNNNQKRNITPDFRVKSSTDGGGDERQRDGGRGRGRGGGRGGRDGGRGGRDGGRGGRDGGRGRGRDGGRGRGGRDGGRGRGGRGGRDGGGRGGRGRGDGGINVMDSSAFPSL